MLIKPINIISIILMIILSYSTIAHATTFYVKPDGVDTNDGSSWIQAFATLQKAIDTASSGDQIWVAQGTYTPGSAQTDTFQLKNGVEIYGGFNPSNLTPEVLDPKDTRSDKTGATTILSGEIGTDDICHVVTSSSTDDTAILDSFTISGGNATGCTDKNGGGIYNDAGSPTLKKVIIRNNTAVNGGGMYNSNNSNPKLIGVTFQENTATNDGGGLYNDGSSPTLTNPSFTNNTATNDGGGMYNVNNSQPTISGGSFSDNQAKNGGGIYNKASMPTISSSNNSVSFASNKATAGNGGGMYNENSSFPLNRVLFQGNSATGDGGGVYNDSNSDPSSVTHAVFSGNKASGNGGGMFCAGSGSGTMTQVTFTGNNASDGGGLYKGSSTWTINNSIFWKNSSEISDNTNITKNSSIIDESSNVADPFILSIAPNDAATTAGNFQLGTNSLALDTGNDTLAPGYAAGPPETADVDLDKNTRIIKATVDMGAYESQAPEVDEITCQTSANCGDDTTPRKETTLEFEVTFDEPVKGVEANDFILTALAGNIVVAGGTQITTAGIALNSLDSSTDYTISPDGTSLNKTYTVTIHLYTGTDRSLLSDGQLRLDIVDDDGIKNEYNIPLGNTGDNTGDFATGEVYTIDTLPPIVTIEQASTQSDSTTASPIEFTVEFSEPVTGFETGDVTLTGTANATTATVTEIAPNDGTTYQVSVSGMSSNGTVIANIEADKATDGAGNNNEASTSTDNEVTYNGIDNINPTVTINQASSQSDPSNNSTIYFTVVFSENIKGNGDDFTNSDVSLTGTTGATTVTVTEITPNDGTTYQIAVSGMNNDGTIVATINANVTRDAANNNNEASTSTDNQVTYLADATIPTATITSVNSPRETAVSTINIQFSEAITGFDISDLSLTRNGDANLLTATQTLTTTNDIAWVLNNLSSLTENDGTYLLTLTASSSNITDVVGNALAGNATVNWEKTSPSVPTPTVTPPPSPTPTVRLTIEMTGMGSGSVKSNPTGINCYSDNQEDCNERYSINTTVTLTPNAATDSIFTGWSGPSDCENGKIFINKTMTCKANFDLLPVALLIAREGNGAITSEPAGIDCRPDNDQCHATFDSGTEVTLTAIPEAGWTLTEWTGGCNEKDNEKGNEKSVVIMDQKQQCQALFEPLPQFNLFVAKTGQGQVTSSLVSEIAEPVLNIDCGEQCQATYQAGTELVLTAIPETGWQLEGWRGHCDETGHVIMAQEYTQCRAIFTQAPLTDETTTTTPSTSALLTIINPSNGTIISQPDGINCGSTCAAEFAINTAITLTTTPAERFALDSWQGDCDASGQVTLDADKQCEAIFLPLNRTPFTLNVYKIGQGTITSQPAGIDCGDSCVADYDGNQPIKLTPTPDDGWKFEGWRGHCDEQGYVALIYDYDFRQCRAIFTQAPVSTTPEPSNNNANTAESDSVATNPGTSNNAGDSDKTPETTVPDTSDSSNPSASNNTGTNNSETTNATQITDNTSNNTHSSDNSNANPSENQPENNVTDEDPAKSNENTIMPALTTIGSPDNGQLTTIPVALACGEHCTSAELQQAPVKLTATPEPGYSFIGWTGACSSTAETITISAALASQCQPLFAPDSDGNGVADVIEAINHNNLPTVSGNAANTTTGWIQFSRTHYTVDEFGNVATITVNRQQNCQGQVRVDYKTTTAGNATQAGLGNQTDYFAINGTLKWHDGDCQSHYFTIPIQDDNLSEGTETVAIELHSLEGNAKILTPQAVLSIIDNETIIEQNTEKTEKTEDVVNNDQPTLETTPSVEEKGEVVEETTGSQTPTGSLTTTAITLMLKVNETTQITLNELPGVLLIKEWPNSAFVSVDGWDPLNNNEVELTLTGISVGETQMLISDNLSAQQVLLEIKVVPAAIEQPTETTDLEEGSQYAEFKVFINVGQLLNYQINGGQGNLSIHEMPNNRFVTLNAWQSDENGIASFTLTGLQAGKTAFLIRDAANPPLYSLVDITVLAKPTVTTDTIPQQNSQTTSSNRPTDCPPALGVNAQGLPIEDIATTATCFIGKLSSHGKIQTNHATLSPAQAKNVRLSMRVWIAPEHVGKAAEFIIIALHNTDSQLLEFTRDEQRWILWNNQHLTSAQYHPQLPEIVDVFIFAGDLSALPGDYTIYLGYRLNDDTIIYNGAKPLHFFINFN
jgi:hypothetical protein